MSDSRLEKFIYAICSMDVSDLPVPLSRIEKLWNCLITGETPDFEPLSRNEKYLMAMLGLYELENLPAPMSRGEKLLYKIAMGETDLSDVPGYLSRYEELLGYLAENGGVGDFEYILQTLNQRLSTLYSTKERPIKSAILKGNTLVNIFTRANKGYHHNATNNGKKGFTMTGDGTVSCHSWWDLELSTTKQYILTFDINVNTLDQVFIIKGNDEKDIKQFPIGTTGKQTVIFTPTASDIRFKVEQYVNGTIIVDNIMLMEYREGMENWDIPYFEGMQSVKMPVLTTTGKNLFDGEIEEGIFDSNGNPSDYVGRTRSKNFIKVPKNTDLYISIGGANNASWTTIYFYNDKKEYTETINTKDVNKTFNTGNNSYIKWKNNSPMSQITNIQIEQGSVATSYEPFKSNILTVNEDVELRGIGDVKDTLDISTGEKVERIGEIVLDGSEDWIAEDARFKLYRGDIVPNKWSNGLSNHFIGNRGQLITGVDYDNYFAINGFGSCLFVRDINLFPNPKSQLNEFKTWLSERSAQGNPVILQYPIATESIKTVDLTTVDQDGQPTKLKTFNNITHVEIKADNIIPSVDLEVATKISETLSTLGLEHHDISETQNQLGQTIDEQSENTDSTMMATTEIYEQIL